MVTGWKPKGKNSPNWFFFIFLPMSGGKNTQNGLKLGLKYVFIEIFKKHTLAHKQPTSFPKFLTYLKRLFIADFKSKTGMYF